MLPKLSPELSAERDYIFLHLGIPDDNERPETFNDITNLLRNYIEKIVSNEIYRQFYTTFCEVYLDANIMSLYEVLNEIRETNPKFRYQLKIKLKSKRHPTEVSVNKRGKVILTKQRTKFSSLF